jgi:hypothetical protein
MCTLLTTPQRTGWCTCPPVGKRRTTAVRRRPRRGVAPTSCARARLHRGDCYTLWRPTASGCFGETRPPPRLLCALTGTSRTTLPPRCTGGPLVLVLMAAAWQRRAGDQRLPLSPVRGHQGRSVHLRRTARHPDARRRLHLHPLQRRRPRLVWGCGASSPATTSEHNCIADSRRFGARAGDSRAAAERGGAARQGARGTPRPIWLIRMVRTQTARSVES